MTRHDVVVVGGRVAGAATALLLARAGLRVMVVDRSVERDTVSTHALMRAGVLQLARWGLLDDVVTAGTPVVHRSWFHYPDHEALPVDIRPSLGVEGLYAPRRVVLDPLLLEAAQAAGADLGLGHSVTGLFHDRGGRVSGVVMRGPDGRERRVNATLVVGADGLRSVVADAVDAPVEEQGRHASGILYRYLDGVPADGYEWFYGDTAAAGLIPTNDGLTCAFVSSTPVRVRALRAQGFTTAFAQLARAAHPHPALSEPLADRLRAGRTSGVDRGWAGSPALTRVPHGPGWALVGDAGHFKDPITAHGITDALRDAELLVDAILSFTSGLQAEQDAMEVYHRTRNQLSRRLLDVTERVAAYDWTAPTVRTLLREVSASMAQEIEHITDRLSLPQRAPLPLHPAGAPHPMETSS